MIPLDLVAYYVSNPATSNPARPLYSNTEQHNPRTPTGTIEKEQPEMVEFLRTASHGQVMLFMFRETFPKLPDSTALLFDEPRDGALGVQPAAHSQEVLQELVDRKKFRIICATHYRRYCLKSPVRT